MKKISLLILLLVLLVGCGTKSSEQNKIKGDPNYLLCTSIGIVDSNQYYEYEDISKQALKENGFNFEKGYEHSYEVYLVNNKLYMLCYYYDSLNKDNKSSVFGTLDLKTRNFTLIDKDTLYSNCFIRRSTSGINHIYYFHKNNVIKICEDSTYIEKQIDDYKSVTTDEYYIYTRDEFNSNTIKVYDQNLDYIGTTTLLDRCDVQNIYEGNLIYFNYADKQVHAYNITTNKVLSSDEITALKNKYVKQEEENRYLETEEGILDRESNKMVLNFEDLYSKYEVKKVNSMFNTEVKYTNMGFGYDLSFILKDLKVISNTELLTPVANDMIFVIDEETGLISYVGSLFSNADYLLGVYKK